MAQNPLERFEKFLAAKGYRLTAERSIVARAVFSTGSPFGPDQLLEALTRKATRRISRATAYRTLSLLTSAGLVRELLPFGDRRFFVVADHQSRINN